MNNTFKRNCIIISVICAINLIASILFILKLHDTVPIHFNFDMICDGLGSKWTGLIPSFILAALIPLLIIGEGHGKNATVNSKPMMVVMYITTIIIVVVNWLMLMMMDSGANIGDKLEFKAMWWLFTFIFGFMFLLIGNYMPTVRQNSTLGIKLPWTLKNENCWNLTHRFTGKLYVITGIFILGMFMFTRIIHINDKIFLYVLEFLIIPVSIIVPTVYSYMHRNS